MADPTPPVAQTPESTGLPADLFRKAQDAATEKGRPIYVYRAERTGRSTSSYTSKWEPVADATPAAVVEPRPPTTPRPAAVPPAGPAGSDAEDAAPTPAPTPAPTSPPPVEVGMSTPGAAEAQTPRTAGLPEETFLEARALAKQHGRPVHVYRTGAGYAYELDAAPAVAAAAVILPRPRRDRELGAPPSAGAIVGAPAATSAGPSASGRLTLHTAGGHTVAWEGVMGVAIEDGGRGPVPRYRRRRRARHRGRRERQHQHTRRLTRSNRRAPVHTSGRRPALALRVVPRIVGLLSPRPPQHGRALDAPVPLRWLSSVQRPESATSGRS